MEVSMRRKQRQSTFLGLPHEIQLEIQSRLPIKDLFRYRCVCKSWNVFIPPDNDKTRTLPLCGLVFKNTNFHLAPQLSCKISYVSMGAKHIIPIKPENNKQMMTTMTVNSGFEKGSLLADLSFEFGSLSSLCQGEFFTIHRGLILVEKNDLTLQVHNPVTKLVISLPIPPIVQHCLLTKQPRVTSAFLINLNPIQVCLYFFFSVVRLFDTMAEIYYSTPRKWCLYKLINVNSISNELLRKSKWSNENYVFINKTNTLFFLTDRHHGLALEIIKVISCGPRKIKEMRIYKFPLPQVVEGGFNNARLGENQECLYLSYHDLVTGGVWFWKRDGRRTSSDNENVNDRWVLLLEIGKTAKLSKSLQLNHNDLFKLVKAGDTIIPIGFHPNFAVALFRVNSCIFAYDLNNKTLEKIGEITDPDYYNKSTIVFPFIPYVVPRLWSTEDKLKLDLLRQKLKEIRTVAYD